MRVLYLFQDEYPWDIRVEKIVMSLDLAGIPTTIVSRNRQGLPREEKLFPNVTVRRLPKGLSSIDRNILNFPAFFSPIWLKELEKSIKKDMPDVLIVRDLPLSPTAYYVGKKHKIPVIMDMAENYPAMIQDTWKFQGPNFIDYIIRNPNLLKKLEEWIVPKMDGIWVVSAASKKRVYKLTGREEKIWIVGNTPYLRKEQEIELHPYAKKIKENSALCLLYVGGLEKTRGLQTVLFALPLIIEKLKKEVHFLIVGQGKSVNDLKNLVTELKLENYVEFSGWIDQKYVPGIISSSDICLIPHYVTDHTNTTIPNKIYDYLAQGKPVVASNAQALRDIVEEFGCGRIYDDHDSEGLANIIVELDNEDLRNVLGNVGRTAVIKKYNWQVDEKVVFESLEQIVKVKNLH